MTPILRFLCVLAAHYGTYEGCDQLYRPMGSWRLIVRFVRWYLGTPPEEVLPDAVWPKWGRGIIYNCPDCNVRFLQDLYIDSMRCPRCATDHRITPR